MRILELSLRNYRVFEEVDLELPARVIGIFGENGAGKTALVESIAFGLYGVNAARTKKNEIRTHGVLTDCEVRVAFEHGGHPYEVRRTLRGKGATPEAELFAGDLTLAAGTTEVDAEIRRLLHMDLQVFRASVFAEQKQLDAFSSLRAGERKEMALRLLGIKPVDDARTAARREARSTKESAARLSDAVADIAALEADLKDAKEAAAEAKAVAKAAALELKAATASAKSARTAFEQLDATRQRVEKLTVKLTALAEERNRTEVRRADLAERFDELTASVAALPELEHELTALGDVEERLRAAARLADVLGAVATAQAKLEALPPVDAGTALAELEAARAALTGARDKAAAARAELDHRSVSLAESEDRLARASGADPSEPCPTCGRPLGDDFAGYLRHCKAQVADAKKAARASETAAKRSAETVATAEAAERKAIVATEAARDAEAGRTQLVGQLESFRDEVRTLLEPFGGEMPDLGDLRASAARAKELAKRVAELGAEAKHRKQLEKDLGEAVSRLGDLEGQLGRLAEEAGGLSFDEAEHGRLRDELTAAERSLEEARAAERDAGDAAKDAERRIAELGGELRQARETAEKVDELRSEARHVERVAMLLDGFRDHLVSRVGPELSREAEHVFRELTNHEYDDLRIQDETLAIQIADGDAYHPIERFSGSETDLANLALRVAISTHLSRVSGADVGLMVLDEVLGSLDEERKDLMVQALAKLSERFHQLFVITHAERVKDQFPATILVAKLGRRRSTAMLV